MLKILTLIKFKLNGMAAHSNLPYGLGFCYQNEKVAINLDNLIKKNKVKLNLRS